MFNLESSFNTECYFYTKKVVNYATFKNVMSTYVVCMKLPVKVYENELLVMV